MFVLLLVGGLVVRQYIGGMPLPVASTSPSDQQTTVAYEQTNTAAQITAAVQMTAYAQSPIATAPQVSPTPPPPTYLTFGDGTYRVGADIKAGTYRTQQGSQSCYYARLSGFGGITSDIIANNLTDYPAIVTISPTDKGFESQNCGTWTSDLSQITTSKTSFDDGIYIIGTDIAPGTYKDTGGNGCYYARLSGFGNTTGDIIANNLANAPSIITISASDKGFQTQGCGTWTKS